MTAADLAFTGCSRQPTNVDSLYVLAGIAPPGVRRSVASKTDIAGGKLMTLAIPVITTNQPQARLKSRRKMLPSCSRSRTVTASYMTV